MVDNKRKINNENNNYNKKLKPSVCIKCIYDENKKIIKKCYICNNVFLLDNPYQKRDRTYAFCINNDELPLVIKTPLRSRTYGISLSNDNNELNNYIDKYLLLKLKKNKI